MRTHVKGVIKVEVVVAVEMTSNEVMDLSFRCRMKVLELVHRLELHHIEAVRKDAIRLPLQKMLRFVRGDVRNGGEDIGTVRS